MSEWSQDMPDQPPSNRSVYDSDGDEPLPASPPVTPLVTSDPTTPPWGAVRGLDSFEPVAPVPPPEPPVADPPAEANRPPRRVGRFVAAAVAAVGLAGGGAYVGATLADDDAPATASTEPVPIAADDPVAADEQPSGPDVGAAPTAPAAPAVEPIPDQPGPVSTNSVEPVADVAAAVAPSVVRIDTATGTGSGVIYDESGLLITNAHVVGNADEVSVQLADGRRTEGTVLGADVKVDIAVVQIDADLGFEVAVFAPTSSVEVGQLAVAIGSPFGLEQSVTAGIISAVNRAISNQALDGTPTVVEMLQTDAPINPGNSGGALADREGRVVGINTSIRTDGTTNGNLGVGFAVPSDTAVLVADRIVAGEPLDSGFLGISGQDPATGDPGALVTDVVDDGPADDAGLEVGDLITAINGEPLPGMTELAARIRLTSPGSTVVVDVLRDGEPLRIEVTLGTLGG